MAPPLAAMPPIGLGTWKAAPGEVGAAVRSALRLGYRHIDCAAIYGNEAEIGAALHAALEQGQLAREQLWITSKLWNDCHAPEQVRPALERTLADLQLDHLDLYLIHWPVVHRHGVLMPSVAGRPDPPRAAAPSRHLGGDGGSGGCGSGEADRRVQLQRGQTRRPAAPLPPPAGGEPGGTPPLAAAAPAAGLLPPAGHHPHRLSPLGSPDSGGPAPLLNDPVITAIAAAHDVSAAQVLLAWGFACGTCVIPKSVNPERQAANLQAASQPRLSAAEMERIAGLDRRHRFVDGSFWELPGGPYTRASLWDEPAAA
jgi:alcohol dehydrogenase (NADP+)